LYSDSDDISLNNVINDINKLYNPNQLKLLSLTIFDIINVLLIFLLDNITSIKQFKVDISNNALSYEFTFNYYHNNNLYNLYNLLIRDNNEGNEDNNENNENKSKFIILKIKYIISNSANRNLNFILYNLNPFTNNLTAFELSTLKSKLSYETQEKELLVKIPKKSEKRKALLKAEKEEIEKIEKGETSIKPSGINVNNRKAEIATSPAPAPTPEPAKPETPANSAASGPEPTPTSRTLPNRKLSAIPAETRSNLEEAAEAAAEAAEAGGTTTIFDHKPFGDLHQPQSLSTPQGIASAAAPAAASPTSTSTSTPPSPRGIASVDEPRGIASVDEPRGIASAEEPRGIASAEEPRGIASAEEPRGIASAEINSIKKKPFTFGDYFERQYSLGCGRHALNNLFGVQYFTNSRSRADTITDQNITTFNAGKEPKLSLYALCTYINTGIAADKAQHYCLDIENYDVNVLVKALTILGYNVLNHVDKKPITVNPKTVGFIGNDDGHHWVAFRRIQADKDKDKYIYIDSNDSRTRSMTMTMTLDQILKSNYNKHLIEVIWDSGEYSLELLPSDYKSDIINGNRFQDLKDTFFILISEKLQIPKSSLSDHPIKSIIYGATSFDQLHQIVIKFNDTIYANTFINCIKKNNSSIKEIIKKNTNVFETFINFIENCMTQDNANIVGPNANVKNNSVRVKPETKKNTGPTGPTGPAKKRSVIANFFRKFEKQPKKNNK